MNEENEADTAGDQDSLRLVVGIGASAGGIPALRPLLSKLPQDAPIAYLILQHTDPTRTGELCKVLASDCALPLTVVQEGERLQPGRVYLVPPDRDFDIIKGRIHLPPASAGIGARHSIDHMLATLAEAFQERVVGVILSGSGMDGTEGMRAVKASAGITIIQDPATADYQSMPEAVMGAELADLILSPEQIPDEIIRILDWNQPQRAPEETWKTLQQLLRLVQRKTGFDFQQYKEATIKRRLARRMQVNRCASLDEYRRLLVRSDTEADGLARDLLISVTSFFRDPEVFAALKRMLQPLVEASDPGDAIRVWVPGCATGEEPYSIAIVLAELLGEQLGRIKVQIFATDVDSRAIRDARQAIYRAESLRAIPEELQRKYFESWDGLLQLRRPLRDMVVFAEHNLTQDPPFTKIDLISCRNVLIYFKREVQEQLLRNFHYALKPEGLMLLGNAESADRNTLFFKRVDEHVKIYRRLDVEGTPPIFLDRRPARSRAKPEHQLQRVQSPNERLQQILLDSYAPPCVLVNSQQDVVFVRGDLSRFVRLPQGDLNVNLVEMAATPEIRIELRLVVHKTLREKERITSHPVPLPDTDPPQLLTIVGLPGEDGHILVLFEEQEAPHPPMKRSELEQNATQRIIELETELTTTREHLNANIQDLEVANEELQSTNEEFQSTTEELQSTVEEYQTTNEELQSTNEELNSVNDELNSKSEALEAANADMQGILDNIAAAIIVLDRDLHVTRYSAASKQIFDLWPTTIGRPFISLGGSLDMSLLARDLHQAVRDRKVVQSEMTLGDQVFDVRIIPRLDHTDALSSLLVAFTHESEHSHTQKQARLLATMVRDSNDAVIVRGLDSRILTWNAAAERLFGYTEAQAKGQLASMLVPAALKAHALSSEEQLLAGDAEMVSEETQLQAMGGEQIEAAITSSVLLNDQDEPFAISTVVRDISRQLHEQEALQSARESAERANLTKSRFLAAASHDLRQPLQSLSLYLATIKSDMDTGKRQEVINKMALSLKAMRNLLNTLLDMSRLDTGRVEPQMKVIPVQMVLDEVYSQIAPAAEANKALSLHLAPCSAFIRSDPALLEEILSNLLFNAVKYTPKGRILIGCRRRGDRLRIDIYDTGPGIAHEHQEEIYDEFLRLPDAQNSEHPGLGLGLSIVRRLSSLLDHPLELNSVVGHGTRFSVYVPRAAASADMPVRPDPVSDAITGRLLLVDDDDAVRDASALYLKSEGFPVVVAASCDEALRLAEEAAPEVIIIDYHLGNENGLEVLQRLRKSLQTPALPAIVVSGESQESLEEAAAAANARLLLKPLDTDEFLRELRELLAARPAR